MGETPSETLCPDSNHPHMIDLGLPNDAKIACKNEGTTKPEETGNSYTWDEAISLCKDKGYRLLTEDEIRELVLNCRHEYMTINETKGQMITASNGKRIFLPLGGYWSCDVSSDGNPYYMYVQENDVQWARTEKSERKLVRPIYSLP